MDQSLITKKVIAYSFKDLMNKMPFAKITVSDIMKQADLRRQTFYYHFQDKYELIEWIYISDTHENISDFLDYEKWDAILDRLFLYFYRERKFYRNAFTYYEDNGFTQSLFENLQALYLKILNDETVTCRTFTESRKSFIAEFLSHGTVGIIIKWIEKDCNVRPKEMADHVYSYLIIVCEHEGEK